jgi:hypothetical protein
MSFQKQANRTSYIKEFSSSTSGVVTWIYKTINGIKNITPSTNNSVYLPNDLIVQGTISNPSDMKLKENINDLTNDFCENILKITPKKYNFINDENKKEHYGIIAQELEEIFPKLVINTEIEDLNDNYQIKTINYLELIPIMIVKMKIMQDEIDKLKSLSENIILEKNVSKK